MKSTIVGSAVAAGRKYMIYEDMTADDVVLILHSTDKFVTELRQKSSYGS